MLLNNMYREKLLNALMFFARETKCPSLVKIFKLLFFLDFYHFKMTGRSLVNLDFFALSFGPVPTDFYDEVKGGDVPEDMKPYLTLVPFETERGTSAFEFKLKKKPDLSVFSPREREILENLAFMFKDVTPSQMSEISHLKNEPWDKTIKLKGPNQPIDYMLALDSDAAVSEDDARELMKERKEILKNFPIKPHLHQAE